jgi:hypothetical protein
MREVLKQGLNVETKIERWERRFKIHFCTGLPSSRATPRAR